MTLAAPSIPILTWHKCYAGSWRGLIAPESFAHPAKFAPLEERFVTLGNANLARHRRKWLSPGCAIKSDVCVRLAQGDSRRFAEIVKADGIVSSPPHADALSPRAGGPDTPHPDGLKRIGHGEKSLYGASRGQIGVLASGSLDDIVTSPPFGERIDGKGVAVDGDTSSRKLGKSSLAQIGSRPPAKVDSIISSPPFEDSIDGSPDSIDWSKAQQKGGRARRSPGRGAISDGYGSADGQIGKLRGGDIEAIVSSPPWEDQESAMNAKKFRDPAKFAAAMSRLDGVASSGRNGTTPAGRLAHFQRQTESTYGESAGQIGNAAGETYWEAMHQVYGQCLLSLKEGGVMAIVVKNYVKDKKRVPLCDQTLRLLNHLGFESICRIRAMLISEERTPGLFHEHVERKERKSFFRRLTEKRGSPRIDWEEVLVVRKPGGAQ